MHLIIDGSKIVTASMLMLMQPTSGKTIYVTGSLLECVRVVGPESLDGRILELTSQMIWPSCTAGSTVNNPEGDWAEAVAFRQTCECQLPVCEEIGSPMTHWRASENKGNNFELL